MKFSEAVLLSNRKFEFFFTGVFLVIGVSIFFFISSIKNITHITNRLYFITLNNNANPSIEPICN